MRTVYLAIMSLSYLILTSVLLNSLVSIGSVLGAPAYTSNLQTYTKNVTNPTARSSIVAKPQSVAPVQQQSPSAAVASNPVAAQSPSAPDQSVSSAKAVEELQLTQKSAPAKVVSVVVAPVQSAPAPLAAAIPVAQSPVQPAQKEPPVESSDKTVADVKLDSKSVPSKAVETARAGSPVAAIPKAPQEPIASFQQPAAAIQARQPPTPIQPEQLPEASALKVLAAAQSVVAQSMGQHQQQQQQVAQIVSNYAPSQLQAQLQNRSNSGNNKAQLSTLFSSNNKEANGVVALTSLVRGGLGPLHLLAETLCDPQPELVGDYSTPLFVQRQSARKSLFDFMSLKFTDLGKLSSRLAGETAILQLATPAASAAPEAVAAVAAVAPLYMSSPQDASVVGQAVIASQHQSPAWPVIGKCTSQDLKLMAEAAWCDCTESAANCKPAMQAANQLKSSPVAAGVQNSPDNQTLLVQQQLAEQQQREKEREKECKEKSLRLTKSLLEHLAENQTSKSVSWPSLYTELSTDECARRRLIDIVNALAAFRSMEGSANRRDNVEYAFAMDDLRVKVLDSDINTPLQVDRQFIAFEQFLQQSVQLVLSNIDPQRSSLAASRYRSLLPGPVSAEDQCIELHQRLLARNTYPNVVSTSSSSPATPVVSSSSPVPAAAVASSAAASPSSSTVQASESVVAPSSGSKSAPSADQIDQCSASQLGQLSDVLKMTAKSLELWSLELDLARHNKRHNMPVPNGAEYSVRRQEIIDCVSGLVDKPTSPSQQQQQQQH